MSATVEHPIRSHLDWVASGARPSAKDVDELVAKCIDEHSEVTATELRREISLTTKAIMEAHAQGRSGDARTLAREATIVLSAALGDLPPAPAASAGKSTREVIDTIPR